MHGDQSPARDQQQTFGWRDRLTMDVSKLGGRSLLELPRWRVQSYRPTAIKM